MGDSTPSNRPAPRRETSAAEEGYHVATASAAEQSRNHFDELAQQFFHDRQAGRELLNIMDIVHRMATGRGAYGRPAFRQKTLSDVAQAAKRLKQHLSKVDIATLVTAFGGRAGLAPDTHAAPPNGGSGQFSMWPFHGQTPARILEAEAFLERLSRIAKAFDPSSTVEGGRSEVSR